MAFLLPTTGKDSLQILHHAVVDQDRNRLVGSSGLRSYSPFKEVVAQTIVKGISAPSKSRRDDAYLPSLDDFYNWSKDPDTPLKDLKGTSKAGLSALERIPSFYLLHPRHLVTIYSKPTTADQAAR